MCGNSPLRKKASIHYRNSGSAPGFRPNLFRDSTGEKCRSRPRAFRAECSRLILDDSQLNLTRIGGMPRLLRLMRQIEA